MKTLNINYKKGSLYFLIMRGFLGFILGTMVLILCIYSCDYYLTEKLETDYFEENKLSYYAYEEDFTSDKGQKESLLMEFDYSYGDNDEMDYEVKHLMILDEKDNVIYSNSSITPEEFRARIDDSQDDSSYMKKLKIYNERKSRIDTMSAALLVMGELLLMMYFVYKMNKKVLRPLTLLKNAMGQFRATDERLEPVSYSGPRELEEICESYNHMALALRKSDEERKKLEEGRERMLAGISHDLKTPVTVIQGYADAILDGTISRENEMTYVETIHKKSRLLSELINSFNEYSRLEHPDFSLRLKRGDAGEYLREYIADRYDELAIAGFSLEVSIPEAPVYAEFDHRELKRVFENLMNNTIRHNPRGTTIYVSLEKTEGLMIRSGAKGVQKELIQKHLPENVPGTGENCIPEKRIAFKAGETSKGISDVDHKESNCSREAAPRPVIRILFGDDGVGISDEIRKNIFDPFVTGDESRRSGKGSGLGLAISKKIIEAHGGYINLRDKNETDHSTEYEILLPVE